VCGCGTADKDSDGDGSADCNEVCFNDPHKSVPGICGCGHPDTDSDGDGTQDCNDDCDDDPLKTAPGVCGCGVSDLDTDKDDTPDCDDECPNDPTATAMDSCSICGGVNTHCKGDFVIGETGVSASGARDGMGPEKAFDAQDPGVDAERADETAVWEGMADENGACWLTIDFGKITKVSKMTISFGHDCASQYGIYRSDNGQTWTLVTERVNAEVSLEEACAYVDADFDTVFESRYVKFSGQMLRSECVSIHEWYMYH
jgi:hypothetical protein